jgi:uncharacterized peroxidase-related enzyme
VLHHSANELPRWYREALGVYTSLLNRCDYCTQHHSAGLRRLLKDDTQADRVLAALQSGDVAAHFTPREAAGLHYAKQLTTAPHTLTESDVTTLREAGFTDGEILEINQIVSYFNYVNRSVLGLGVNLTGDDLGPTQPAVP